MQVGSNHSRTHPAGLGQVGGFSKSDERHLGENMGTQAPKWWFGPLGLPLNQGIRSGWGIWSPRCREALRTRRQSWVARNIRAAVYFHHHDYPE